MHDPQRRFGFRGGTQRGHELLLVRIRRGQPEEAVLVPERGQCVDQRLSNVGIVTDQEPG